ncbi:MAG: aminoglycoside phosphotransferase family protein [Dehalococcoidia bacterium]|jgi:aminoglycoside phosphotransferase (APT) family kinase protein
MQGASLSAAIEAAISAARSLGLQAEDVVVLHDSNRAALRLLPCDTLARVATGPHRAGMRFEANVARRLARTEAPVAGLDPRCPAEPSELGEFVVSFWTFFETNPEPLPPEASATALHQLHAAYRTLDIPAPHFTDRVAEAQRIVDAPNLSPALGDDDRKLLRESLRKLTLLIQQRTTAEQLLHGEPHPGNLLNTRRGPLFIDFETCCRGPVEFDIAHADEAVALHYPNADRTTVALCRALKLAMVAAWRWDKDDLFPNGHDMGRDFVNQLREAASLNNLDAMP